MNSIKVRLTVRLFCTILPLLAVSGFVLYAYTARALDNEFNGNLSSRLRTFAKMSEWDEAELDPGEVYIDHGDDEPSLLKFDFAEISLPEFDPSPDAEYYQVMDPSGLIYARSPSLKGKNLATLEEAMASETIRKVILPDGRRGRMATLRFEPGVDEDGEIPPDAPAYVLLTMARSTKDLGSILAILRTSMLFGSLATMLVIAVVIWRVTKRGLAPLVALSDELRGTGPADLSKRVTAGTAPVELGPIYARLNELLDRVEATMERERRFASDVAHELRTPIAELRTLAEVCAGRSHLAEAERSSYEDTLQIAIRMERLVTALLELSRWSSGELGSNYKRADLGKLIETAWQPLREAAEEKGLHAEVRVDTPIEVDTDPVILGMIFANLLSNAVAYTPEGGEIELTCEKRNGNVAVTLSNTTDDLAPDDLPKLFDKFWRKNRSDHATDQHFGLGLPLVAALSRVLGVQLKSEMPSPGVFRVNIVHPR